MGRPHLRVLREKGKAYKQAAQIPAAEQRAETAAASDLTATTMKTARTNCAKCLVKFSELVQRPDQWWITLDQHWFDGALTVRQFLPGEQIWQSLVVGKISGGVEMPTSNNDQIVPRRSEFRQLCCSGYIMLAGIVYLVMTWVGHQSNVRVKRPSVSSNLAVQIFATKRL